MAARISRRRILQLSVGLGGTAVLAACTPQTVEVEKEVTRVVKETVVVSEPSAPEAKRISYWSVWSQTWQEDKQHGMYQLTERFNEENEGELYVDYVYSPVVAGTQMSEKLLTAIAGGTPPETATFDRFLIASWAAEDTLTDISTLADSAGITEDQYYKWAWEEIHWKDKMYGLPVNGGVWGVMYYNKGHLREAGFDPDNFTTSLDEMDAMAEALTQKEGPRYKRLGFIPWVKRWPYGIGWTFGAEFYDKQSLEVTVNDPRMVEGMEWELSYAEKYDIADLDTFAQAFGGAAQDPFVAELLSMTSSLSNKMPDFKRFNPDMELGSTYMPWPEGGRAACWNGGWSVVLPKGALSLDEGWQFISWLTDQPQMEWYSTYMGQMPVHPKTVENPYFSSDPDLKFVAENLLPIADVRPVLPVGQLLWTGLNEIEDLVLHGQGGPKELLDDLNQRANEEMAQYL